MGDLDRPSGTRTHSEGELRRGGTEHIAHLVEVRGASVTAQPDHLESQCVLLDIRHETGGVIALDAVVEQSPSSVSQREKL